MQDKYKVNLNSCSWFLKCVIVISLSLQLTEIKKVQTEKTREIKVILRLELPEFVRI